MIFVGDISLPFKSAIKLNLPSYFNSKRWIGNLEGPIITEFKKFQNERVVVNHKAAIQDLIDMHHYIFCLANNHIFDSSSLDSTQKYLEDNKIGHLGAGINLKEASKPYIFKQDKVILLNFGWQVIQCEVTKNNRPGVNPFVEEHIKNTVADILKLHNGYKLVLVMHWDYELEAYPMPHHRRIAFDLIDMGVEAIIGHHPHRVQGFELYKNKPIIYSVGNWLFKQSVYNKGKIKFPTFCNRQLAFELDLKTHNHLCHFFSYNHKNESVDFECTEPLLNSKIMKEYSPFSDMSHKDYDKWFKKSRYHKKIIPVYYSYDFKFIILLKNKFNKLRDFLIHIMIKFR